MCKTSIRVLLVEDNPDDAEFTELCLAESTSTPFVVQHCHQLGEAVVMLDKSHFDVILLDLGLPDSDGLSALSRIRRLGRRTPIIVQTGLGDEQTALTALQKGAQDYLVKGSFSAELLSRAIRYAIRRQQLVRQLSDAKQLLKKKNRRLSKLYKTAHTFVDNVSHEFRTPLTVIRDYASLLQDGLVGDVSEEQRRFLGVIGDRTEDLNTMVDDMLDVSKLEAGMLSSSRKKCSVLNIVCRVQPALERKACIRDVKLDVDIDDNLPEVYCDLEKAGRVIVNLTVNAIKFCGQPGVVRLWAQRDTREGGVVIGVTDNGPGLDPQNLAAIFQRFRQLESNCRSSTKGFGLGLNIAKELVDLNFGEMTVDSTPGEGSTFSFTLPPAEPSNVMRRYLQRTARRCNGGATVTLIRGEVCGPVDPETADDVDALLAYLLRGNDLLFRLDVHQWLLVLSLNEIEVNKFLDRAAKVREDANRNRPFGPLPELALENIGTWNVQREKRELMRVFDLQQEALEPACV